MSDIAKRQKLIQAALRYLQAEHGDPANPHYADELDYAEELLEEAARDLNGEYEPVAWMKGNELGLGKAQSSEEVLYKRIGES